MKKIRYIPFGYSVRNGRTIVDHTEADIIREIFESYIQGSSLKDIAENLTARRIPYAEKTDTWDKSKVARILGNSKYVGTGEYDPIIDEAVYDGAAAVKAARNRLEEKPETASIRTIRTRAKCGCCGGPMIRKTCVKASVKESWVCADDACGFKVRISDGDLLRQLTRLLNRIIVNADLMIPQMPNKHSDSPAVCRLQADITAELEKDNPCEDLILDRFGSIAEVMYRESQTKKMLVAQQIRHRLSQMKPIDSFSPELFTELVSYITLTEQGTIILYTKTDTEITEGDRQ